MRGHLPVRSQMTIHLHFECTDFPNSLLRRIATQEQHPPFPGIVLGSIEEGGPVLRYKHIYNIRLEVMQTFILKIGAVTVNISKL